MEKNQLQSYSFLALLGGISVLLFFVFKPFIQILALAAVFAVLFHKPYEYLARRLRGWNSVAAFVIVGAVLLFFIVPLFFLGMQIFRETQNLYIDAQGNGGQYIQFIQHAVEAPVQRIVPEFTFNIAAAIGNILAFISANLASILSQTFIVTLETFLMLLAFFFFLRDGNELLAGISTASPFGKEESREILEKMHLTIKSVINGTLFVALIRWILVGVGFYILHIPNSILWGSIGGVIGAIPGLGTAFAFIPAVVYLYLLGHHVAAIVLGVYGLIVLMLVDNILTPYFFGKGLAVAPIFVLFSILGGLFFFGPLGFILGPLVLSVFLSVFRIYSTTRHTSTTE